jgi:hypothetical protein
MRGREGVRVARGHDEAVALVAHEAAGGGADGGGGDDGKAQVHGFVADQAPRLPEGRRGDGRHNEDGGGAQEVAHALLILRPQGADARCGRRALGAGQDELGLRGSQRRPRPRLEQHVEALGRRVAADERETGRFERERVRVPPASRTPRPPPGARATRAARRGRAHGPRRAARRPPRRPPGGTARRAGARRRRAPPTAAGPTARSTGRTAPARRGRRGRTPAGRSARPSRRPRRGSAARGEASCTALGHVAVRDTGVLHAHRRVVRAPAEQRELDPDQRVEFREGARAVGGDEVRDEEDRAAVGRPASPRRAPRERVLVRRHCRPSALGPGERPLHRPARASPRSSSARGDLDRSRSMAPASASTSPGGTSRMPSPASSISAGPGSPRQPIAGRPPAIAST